MPITVERQESDVIVAIAHDGDFDIIPHGGNSLCELRPEAGVVNLFVGQLEISPGS